MAARTFLSFMLLASHGSSFVTPAPSFSTRHVNSYALKMAEDGMGALYVSELKRLLTERGVDFRDCLEKRDLVERLASSKQQVSSTPPKADLISTFKRVSPSVAYIQTTATIQQRNGFSMRAKKAKVTIAQRINENNAVSPSVTTDGEVKLEYRRALDTGMLTTRVKPNKSVDFEWQDGPWQASFSAPMDGIVFNDGVKVNIRRVVDVN